MITYQMHNACRLCQFTYTATYPENPQHVLHVLENHAHTHDGEDAWTIFNVTWLMDGEVIGHGGMVRTS